ncbi:MAG: L,D-transpeptidase/peptidoglycan binding protein [Actinomycetota bacterium]|nr:L,D-transpeptidase/peptidoglycan binding protein [Actinomycetota bacterium]
MEARLKTHHKVLIAAVVALTATLLLAVGVYAYDRAQEDQIAPGVSVGGVDVGGRSADAARAVIEDEVVAPLQKPVEISFDGETYRLTSKQLDQRADVDGMVEEAIAASRSGNIVDRVSRYVQGSEVDDDLEARVSYSDEAVAKFVAEIAEEVNRDPQDASIEPSSDSLTPTPSEPGIALREDELTQLVTEQVESPGVEKGIEATVERTRPEITTKELASEYPTYITIDQSEYRLRLFVNLNLAKSYDIAVGGGGYATPTGLHSIQDKQVNPTWNVPTSSWAGSLAGQSIPPGPSNPLKARWMGIYNGAGIHGTDDVGSIGSAASHGCVRMRVEDVTDLFDRVDVGTPIYIQ